MIGIDASAEVLELVESIPDAPGPRYKAQNVAFRAELCDMMAGSADFVHAVHVKCSQDVVFWFNTFVWTQNPKDFPEDPKQPVILFPKQARFLRKLDANVEAGRPLLLEKSREQLASVMMANYTLWRLFYRDNAAGLVGSYKKDVVEGNSYAKAIFPKMDYTIKHMPDVMLPQGWVRKKPGPCRRDMVFVNPETGKAVEGETCNDDFARSGRFAYVWLDEFAHIKKQEDIHTAVGNTTNCFVYTTTPRGIELFAQMARAGEHDVFRLHWTDNYLWHPRGFTPEQCDWENGVWPEEWLCSAGCKAHPEGGQPHSERYDRECAKYNWNRVKIAQELDIAYQKSGSSVFDPDKVQAAIRHLVAPETRASMKFHYVKLEFKCKEAVSFIPDDDEDIKNEYFRLAKKWPVVARVVEQATPLRVWKMPFSCKDKECVCKGTGLHTYVVGADTAKNIDGDYDCAYVIDITAGEVVAEWHGQASYWKKGNEWAKLCKWYGSASVPGWSNAWHSIEHNDQGLLVAEVMIRLGVNGHISRNERNKKKKMEGKYGVHVNRWSKPHIINGCLQPEIDNGDPVNPHLPRLVCPFVDFWKECETFVYKYPDKTENRPESARMEAQTRSQHDDRVMAMGVGVYGAIVRYGRIRGYTSSAATEKLRIYRERAQFAPYAKATA